MTVPYQRAIVYMNIGPSRWSQDGVMASIIAKGMAGVSLSSPSQAGKKVYFYSIKGFDRIEYEKAASLT